MHYKDAVVLTDDHGCYFFFFFPLNWDAAIAGAAGLIYYNAPEPARAEGSGSVGIGGTGMGFTGIWGKTP